MTKIDRILRLKRTKDSFFIDTSYISEKQVIDIAIKEIKKKLILFSHCNKP